MQMSFMRNVRRRWYLLPAVMLVAGVLTAFVTTHWVTVTSRVIVLYPGVHTNQNFRGVASSITVASMVARDLHVRNETASQLLAQVIVTREPHTDVYDVSVRDTSPERAEKICSDWVQEAISLYTTLSNVPASLDAQQARDQLGQLQQSIASLQQQIAALEYQQSGSGTAHPASKSTPRDRVSEDQALNAMLIQLNNIIAEYNQLEASPASAQPGAISSSPPPAPRVLDSARVIPSNMPALLTISLGLAVLLWISSMVMWTLFDHRIREPHAIEQILNGVCVLPIAAVPTQRELRHVASGSWPVDETTGAVNHPGMWPALLTLAASKRTPVAKIESGGYHASDGHQAAHKHSRSSVVDE